MVIWLFKKLSTVLACSFYAESCPGISWMPEIAWSWESPAPAFLYCLAWGNWIYRRVFWLVGVWFFPHSALCLLWKGSASGPVDIVCVFPVCSCRVREILALVLPSSSTQSCLEGLAIAFQTWYYSAELPSWSFFSLFKWEVSISFTSALVMVCMSKFGIKAFLQLP